MASLAGSAFHLLPATSNAHRSFSLQPVPQPPKTYTLPSCAAMVW